MGSYALSQNTSNTQYQNLPVTQENVTNPLNLVNSQNARLGSSETILQNGSTLNSNVLDGGAINSAFDFGSRAVQIIADLTTKQNEAILSANAATVGLAKDAQNALDKNVNPQSAADWMQNKTLILGLALVSIAYIYFRK